MLAPIAIYYSCLIVIQNHTGKSGLQPAHRDQARSLLRKSSFLSLALLLLGSSIPVANARPRADGPEAVMASTKRDFGEVFAGEELEQNFPVHNAGTKPLELSQKSTLSVKSTGPDYPFRAAVWRPSGQLFVRTASAKPAAPG